MTAISKVCLLLGLLFSTRLVAQARFNQPQPIGDSLLTRVASSTDVKLAIGAPGRLLRRTEPRPDEDLRYRRLFLKLEDDGTLGALSRAFLTKRDQLTRELASPHTKDAATVDWDRVAAVETAIFFELASPSTGPLAPDRLIQLAQAGAVANRLSAKDPTVRASTYADIRLAIELELLLHAIASTKLTAAQLQSLTEVLEWTRDTDCLHRAVRLEGDAVAAFVKERVNKKKLSEQQAKDAEQAVLDYVHWFDSLIEQRPSDRYQVVDREEEVLTASTKPHTVDVPWNVDLIGDRDLVKALSTGGLLLLQVLESELQSGKEVTSLSGLHTNPRTAAAQDGIYKIRSLPDGERLLYYTGADRIDDQGGGPDAWRSVLRPGSRGDLPVVRFPRFQAPSPTDTHATYAATITPSTATSP